MFLILITFLSIFFNGYVVKGRGLRESMIRSFVLILGLVAGMTEILSLFSLITRQAVITSWSILILVQLVIIFWELRKREVKLGDLLKSHRFQAAKPYAAFEILILASLGLILLVTLVVALAAPPNNYDSMTYHMARVPNWIQNQDVSYYPTAIPRQNFSMPLAEYVILHLQIMSRSDQFANLVQWSAFALIILLVSEIANRLHISRRGQLVTALFAATMPMAILQSSSTQNDLVTGVGCLSFAYFLFLTIRENSWEKALFSGVSLGLAILTKGTAYLYCAGIGLVLGSAALLVGSWKEKISISKKFVVIIVLALVLNGGMYLRNINLYSQPLSDKTDHVISDEISISGLYTNLIRNGVVHLALPLPVVNEHLTLMVGNLLGEKNTNPDYTFGDSVFTVKFSINEDESGNLFHFVFLLIGVLIFPWIKGPGKKDLALFLVAMLLASVLFSLAIKWQPWGTRLQLPFYLLGAPLAGYYYDQQKSPRWSWKIILVLITLSTIPYLILNETRPLVPVIRMDSPLKTNMITRFISNHPLLYNPDIVAPFYWDSSVLYVERGEQYFSGNQEIKESYFTLMEAVNELDLEAVGLEFKSNNWEYPIWVLAGRHATKGSPEIIHVAVDDVSRMMGSAEGQLPEYVISTKGANSYFLQELDYRTIVDTKYIDLLSR